MYIRTTRYQVKKGSISRFNELAEYGRAKAGKLDGLVQNFLAIDESGKGLMIGIWENREKLEAAREAVKENWAAVMEHMEGPLQIDEYSTAVSIKG